MKRTTTAAAAALGLALALSACADADGSRTAETGVRTEVDTLEGVVTVRNIGAPSTWTAESVLRLGAEGELGAASPEEFGHVSSVVADSEGSVYVADAQAPEIRVFDREGAGPGEYRSLQTISWMDDTLALTAVRPDPVGGATRFFDWWRSVQLR